MQLTASFGTPNMGVDLWGEVDREVDQSTVRKRDSLRRQYAKCFFVSEVQGEGGHRPTGSHWLL
jgi:hypothetical protein